MFFVNLAPIPNPDLVALTIAQTLAVSVLSEQLLLCLTLPASYGGYGTFILAWLSILVLLRMGALFLKRMAAISWNSTLASVVISGSGH